jgi:uroporphyrinogen-III decarboxylase
MPQLAGNASGFAARQAEVGDAGIVDVSLRGNPAGGVASMFGSELFAMMSVTDRSIIHSLCRHRMEVMLARLKHLLRLGVGPYLSMSGEEMIVPPLHGPVDFDDFNVRYDKPIIDLIHEAGGRVHVHSHGRIGKVIGGFLESGVDVLHPFEPPPMGDITPAEAKKAVRGRICIEGNIQIADMYERSPEQIRWHVTELIRDAFEDRRGLIISPTASLYQYGKGEMCMPQIKAMVEAVMASAQKPA